MKIKEINKLFKLNVLGYEYPQSRNVDDANWLKIKVDCIDGDLQWTSSGSFMRTIEIEALFNWLIDIENNKKVDRLYFTENEISFDFDVVKGFFIVCLDFDLHPKGMRYDLDCDDEYKIEFCFNSELLTSVINDVKKISSEYPVRSF